MIHEVTTVIKTIEKVGKAVSTAKDIGDKMADINGIQSTPEKNAIPGKMKELTKSLKCLMESQLDNLPDEICSNEMIENLPDEIPMSENPDLQKINPKNELTMKLEENVKGYFSELKECSEYPDTISWPPFEASKLEKCTPEETAKIGKNLMINVLS